MFLYPVIFSRDLSASVEHTVAYYRAHRDELLPALLTELAAELDRPTIEARTVEQLMSNPSETEVRRYLRGVLDGLGGGGASADR